MKMDIKSESLTCVMCTYNGGEYIYEQLESISKQTIRINKLVICDDASQDETIDIITLWMKTVNIVVELYRNPQPLGCIKNFEKALSLADGDYIFFADQDDIWLSNKVELTLKKMKEIEAIKGSNTPCLVHSDLRVVDKNLTLIHESFLENQGLSHIEDSSKQIYSLIVQNFITGCTIVINNALKKSALPFPENITMHDHWLAIVASLIGEIGFVDAPTILYRQHGNNTVGASKYLSISSIRKVFNVGGMLSRIDKSVKQLNDIVNYKNGCLVAKNRIIVDFMNDIDECNYYNILSSRICKQGKIRNLFFKLFMLLYIKKQMK